MKKPEIRKDYFKDDYVIISPNRAKRPLEANVAAVTKSTETCPFCPDNFHLDQEKVTYVDNGYNDEWQIVSIINKYAALTLDNHSAYGQTEVIIEGRKHGLDINDFSIEHIVRVFDAYIDRFLTLRNLDGIKHVIVFKNEGGKAGASVVHTHSQVYALPVLPAKIEREARAYNKYRLEHMTCPYCDIIALETDKPRVIWEDENVFALSPYASDAPYGAWIMPKRHIKLMSELTRGEKESIAYAMKLILGKLDKYGIAYNYFIENAVNSEDYHMHIKIAPRPNIWAGLELGTGVIVNPISPEYAAEVYRSLTEIQHDPRF
jgi:UDPglucose--hexose-1-phosphate uridylyltransferase